MPGASKAMRPAGGARRAAGLLLMPPPRTTGGRLGPNAAVTSRLAGRVPINRPVPLFLRWQGEPDLLCVPDEGSLRDRHIVQARRDTICHHGLGCAAP